MTTASSATIAGGRAVVEALRAAGVDHAFCVPGESFLGVLDALYDSGIRVIATRHEGGASFMAEAYAKLTRKPAVCLGTRAVGGGNLLIGLHTARQDSSPVIGLLGHVNTEARYREAFQESELTQLFAPVVKWAVEPPSADRLGELTLRAARTAVSGRPGPVVIALREDILNEPVPALEPEPLVVARPAPDPAAVTRALELLRAAERPLLLLGGGVLAAGATDHFVRLAEAEELPAMSAWRRPDAFPNDHRLYLGSAGLGSPPSVAARLKSADLVLAVGTRLNEFTSHSYTVPAPGTRLIHVDVAAEDLGGHARAELGIVADAALFGEALLAAAKAQPASPAVLASRKEPNADDRAAWEAQTQPGRGKARPGYVDQQAVVAYLRGAMPPDTITTTDAGNFAGWPARFLRWNRPGTFLGPTSGAMGYAVPAAIGAKLARPDQPVVAFAGDGGFLMTGAELETAVRAQAPVIVFVYDNAQYGTIIMHQEREHPGRPVATALGPVDFAAFARSLGALGFAIRDEADLPAAFDEAIHADRPSLLHVTIDPRQLSVAADSA